MGNIVAANNILPSAEMRIDVIGAGHCYVYFIAYLFWNYVAIK